MGMAADEVPRRKAMARDIADALQAERGERAYTKPLIA